MSETCTLTDYEPIGGGLLLVHCFEPAIVRVAIGCESEHVETDLACSGCLAELQMELAGDRPDDCPKCGRPRLITIREIAEDDPAQSARNPELESTDA